MIKPSFVISALLIFVSVSACAQPEITDNSKPEAREYRRNRLIAETKSYGDNIIRIMPFRIMDGDGLGLSVDYEHILGAKKNVGLVLPITFSFSHGSFANSNGRSNVFTYFSPGIKIYPFGQRKLTYAVGPTLMFGYGDKTYYDHSFGFPGGPYTSKSFRFGVIANNYLNIQLSSKFNFGLEWGIGVRYFNQELGDINDQTNYINLTQNVALSFGYRF